MIASRWLPLLSAALASVTMAQVVIVTVTHTRRPSFCSNTGITPFTTTVTVGPSSWSSLAGLPTLASLSSGLGLNSSFGASSWSGLTGLPTVVSLSSGFVQGSSVGVSSLSSVIGAPTIISLSSGPAQGSSSTAVPSISGLPVENSAPASSLPSSAAAFSSSGLAQSSAGTGLPVLSLPVQNSAPASSLQSSAEASLSSGPVQSSAATGLPVLSLPVQNSILASSLASSAPSSFISINTPITTASTTSSEAVSTVVLVSTATVVPTPIDDIVNAGEPFNLAFDIGGFFRKYRRQTASPRTVRVYVMANGNTTTDSTKAASFRLLENTLLVDNITMSTSPTVNSQVFAAIEPVGPWTTNFTTSMGRIQWNRTEFDGGSAQFFRVPPDQTENAQIVVKFRGENAPEWVPLTFAAVPAAPNVTSSVVDSSTVMAEATSSQNSPVITVSSIPLNSLVSTSSSTHTPSVVIIPISDDQPLSSNTPIETASAPVFSSQIAAGTSTPGTPSVLSSTTLSLLPTFSTPGVSLTTSSPLSSLLSATQPSIASLESSSASAIGPSITSSKSTALPGVESSIASVEGSTSYSTWSSGPIAGSVSSLLSTPPVATSSSPAISSSWYSSFNAGPSIGSSAVPSASSSASLVASSSLPSRSSAESTTTTSVTSTISVFITVSASSSTVPISPAQSSASLSWSQSSLWSSSPAYSSSSSVAWSSSDLGHSGSSSTFAWQASSSPGTPSSSAQQVSSSSGPAASSALSSPSSSSYVAVSSSIPSSVAWSSSAPGQSGFSSTFSWQTSSPATSTSAVQQTSPSSAQISSSTWSSRSSSVSVPVSASTSSSVIPSSTPTPEPSGVIQAVGNYHYLGCYTESRESGQANTLDGKDPTINHQNMTIPYCASICSGFRYFGVEYSGECYCGDTISPLAGPALESDCNMHCDGAPLTICGGSWRLSAYERDSSAVSSGVSSSVSASVPSSVASSIASNVPSSVPPSVPPSVPVSSSISEQISSSLILSTSSSSAVPSSTPPPSPTCTGNGLLHLPSPTPVLACLTNDDDDDYGQIVLPFPVQLYGVSSVTLYAGVNGYLSIGDPYNDFEITDLPSPNLPPGAALPYWDDLYITAGLNEGIWYSVAGSNPTDWKVTIEWRVRAAFDSHDDQIADFQLTYSASTPGVVTYHYYQLYEDGNSASIGVQGTNTTGPSFFQYSYQQPLVAPGDTITCNTFSNTCTDSNPHRV